MAGVIVLLVVLLGWALVARRLARWSITTAIAMVLAGMALTAGADPVITLDLETKTVERGVEVVLAILLFIDATEVPHGILGREPRITIRLLAIGLPLSLLLAWLAGFALLPSGDAWVLALLAIIVVPVDLAPAVAIVRDRRVPRRLREIVNVEAGLNDGLVAPLFLFCVAGATAAPGSTAAEALVEAGPAILVSLGVGAAVGVCGAQLLTNSWNHGWSEPSALRLGVLALPLLAYALAILMGGNGFVAAFLAGAFFASGARELPAGTLQLTEDVGELLALIVWFVFGKAVNEVLGGGVTVGIVVYAVLALTAVRILPILLALRGTGIGRRDAVFLGWMGPRGLASIVFGFLALIDLEGAEDTLVTKVMVVTVLLSVVLHGLSAGPIGAAYGRRRGRPPDEDGGDAEAAPGPAAG